MDEGSREGSSSARSRAVARGASLALIESPVRKVDQGAFYMEIVFAWPKWEYVRFFVLIGGNGMRVRLGASRWGR